MGQQLTLDRQYKGNRISSRWRSYTGTKATGGRLVFVTAAAPLMLFQQTQALLI